jgi:hypothetical protein
MSHRLKVFPLGSLVLAVSACTTLPTGPSVLVLPGDGKRFDQFRSEDLVCRHYAFAQIGGTTPGQAAANSSEEAQQRYDIAYIQCMYAKGNRVPVPDDVPYQTRDDWQPPPPPGSPPPGESPR